METQIKPTATSLVNFPTAVKGLENGKKIRRKDWDKDCRLGSDTFVGHTCYSMYVLKANGAIKKKVILTSADTEATDWMIE